MTSGVYVRTAKNRENISKAVKRQWRTDYDRMSKINIGRRPWNKGNYSGYEGAHRWIDFELGKPRKCENCNNENAKIYDWANISGEYLKDVSDWVRLCRSCHQLFDNVGSKRATFKRRMQIC